MPIDNEVLPLLRDQPRPVRLVVGALFAVMATTFAVQVLQVVTGIGGLAATHTINQWVGNIGLVCAALVILARAVVVRRERTAWAALGAGVLSWALGSVYFYLALHDVETAPYPSISDGLWLGVYPCAYAGVGLLLRARVRDFHPSMWLDGLIGAVTITAYAAALVLPPVIREATGSAAAVITNIAYPVADTVLLVLLLGGTALCGWRPGRSVFFVAGGLLALATFDSAYFALIASGAYHEGTLLDVGWLFAFVLIAVASWQPPGGERVRSDGWAMLVVPASFTVAAIALLLYDHVVRLTTAAVGLAAIATALSLLRTGLTFREVRALSDSRQMALTDELTGLGNRRALHHALTAALQAEGQTPPALAVLLLDLDRFKQLNDSLGHRAGDLLLVELAERLEAIIPPGAVVTRLGGDEFAVVLVGVDDDDFPVQVAHGVRGALKLPFDVDGMTVHVDGSVGVARCPEDGTTVESLLQRADVAMYLAKERRTGVERYSAAVDTTREDFALVADLRRAIAARELVLHYQPKAALPSADVGAVEALVRWQHPEHGLLPPHRFVTLAEQAGLMPALTRVVLDVALAQVAAWDAQGRTLGVAVNVSTVNLLDPTFPACVGAALARSGVPADRLVLEITEGTLMTDPRRAAEVLLHLRGIGVSVAIDDFGTGYSSLAYLKDLAVDELKIDRAFIASLAKDPATALIVSSTIGLAHGLGLRVVAEGVEDQCTWDRLVTMGCDQIQGYHLSRPIPAEELTAWLDARLAGGRKAPRGFVPIGHS